MAFPMSFFLNIIIFNALIYQLKCIKAYLNLIRAFPRIKIRYNQQDLKAYKKQTAQKKPKIKWMRIKAHSTSTKTTRKFAKERYKN